MMEKKPPNRMKELREASGMSQPDLAKKMGTTYQTVHKLENGLRKLSPAWIYKVCKALHCQPHQLLPEFMDLYTPRQLQLLSRLENIDREERALTKELLEGEE